MNRPPAEYLPVAHPRLRIFSVEAFLSVGMPADQAAFLADLLVTNDLRGVFSHGTQQVPRYVAHFQKGELTPISNVTTLSESPTTLVLDGGGGLGYFPSHEATLRLIDKAIASGIAVATTRNHGHFGAAGIYARMPLPHDLFCYVTSGHQLNLHPGDFVMSAAGGSPMAFGIPTDKEPPFVLDFGAIHDMYKNYEEMKPIVEMVPSTVLRSFGLGCACQALGGLLCGVPLDGERAQRAWSGANQGSFIIIVDIKRLFPIDTFKAEMDAYAQRVRTLKPFHGIEQSLLPGEIEWKRERLFAENGIPLSQEHANALRKVAHELDIAAPF